MIPYAVLSWALPSISRICDCACGLRYARHVVEQPRETPNVWLIVCACGRCLEMWRGAYWLDYEPEERTSYLN